MRILRGKSSLEVSSQGFAWFVVGFVLATFIGGAVRTMLSSDKVHKRIVEELKSRFPKHEFQIGKTEVLLSSGMWPGLGLKVEGLVFRQETCDKLSFQLEVPTAILPIDMFSLRKGKVRLGHVEMRDGRIHFNYRACPPPSETELSASAEEPKAPTKPSIAPENLNWRRAGEHLDAIELRDFVLTYERNRTWKISVKTMELDFSGSDLTAQGLLEIHKSRPFGELIHAVDFEAHGDDSLLQWGVQSEFKEGHVTLKGSLDLTSSASVVQLNARQLPMKDVVSELHQMGFVEKDLRLKATWLTCALNWEGQFTNPKAAPVKIKDCKMEGGYGRLEIEPSEYWIDQQPMFKVPAKLRVERLQIQPLLEALDRKVLPAVLSRPGIWSGDLQFLGPASWQLEGQLENAEVVFSNQSVRGKQMLESLRTKISKSGNLLSGKIDALKIQGGEFEGRIEFQLQEDWRNGTFEADISQLKFSPQIQTLLTGGTIGAVALKGQGSLLSGELGHWNGKLDLGEIRGVGWGGAGIQIHSRYQPGVFSLEARAREISVDRTWPQFLQLKTVMGETQSPTRWKDIQGKVEIERAGGVIQSVSAVETAHGAPWRIKGGWVRDGEFNAVLSVSSSGKARNFILKGEKGVLVVHDEAGVSR